MEHEHILPSFIKYVSMNVLGMLGLSCYILADTWFIAKGLGADGLAALNLAIPVYSFIQGSGLMVGMGGATKYSVLRGADEQAQAQVIFTKSLWYTLALSAIYVLLALFASQTLATWLGAEGVVHPMTTTYLQVLMLFAPAFLVNNLLLCFMRNDGGPQLAMAGMVVGSLANIVLDYLFIFPMGMGIFGAVLATGIAPLISIAILTTWFIRRRSSFGLVKVLPDGKTVAQVSALGVSALITEVSAGVVMIVFNLIILSLEGSVGVAAYGVVANLSLVILAMFNGIGQGIQPLVSRYYGAGRRDTGVRVCRYALILAITFAVAVYAVIALFAPAIAASFNSQGNEHLQQIAEMGLRLYFTALVFAGFNAVSAVYLNSIERPRPAFVISMLRGIVLILPLAFLLSWQWGMLGVWLTFPAAELGTAVVTLVVWRQIKGKEKKVLLTKAERL